MAFIRKSEKPPTRITSESNGNFSKGEKIAPTQLIELAKKNSIETSPLDVHALVKLMNIQLVSIPMKDEISGSLSLSEDGKEWTIRVNALHHPNRQRFTIAHELAHYACHRSQQARFEDQNFFRKGDMNAMEAEANRFAGELLMPEQLFRDRTKLFNGSIESIAKYFQASTLAVRVRAKQLGMKGHGLE
jgi:Zn-dependent peptidase ImmA (M78 family)